MKFKRDIYGRRQATTEEFPELRGAPTEEGCKPSLATVKPFGKQARLLCCRPPEPWLLARSVARSSVL